MKLVLTPNDDVARVAPGLAPRMVGQEAYKPIRTESERDIGDLEFFLRWGVLRENTDERWIARLLDVRRRLSIHFQENRMGSSRRNPSRFVVKKSPKLCRPTRDSETRFHVFQKERRKVPSPFLDLLANSLMQQRPASSADR